MSTTQDHQAAEPPPAAAGASADATAAEATPAQSPEERAAALEAELAEMRDRWMRAEAENQNVRNRAKRDVDDARQYAVQNFARDVVEAAENLRRGLASIPAATADEPPVVAKLREGFEGVERSFVAMLERNGIVGADPTGQPFDANLHQAMAEQPSADAQSGTVLQAWTAAWTLNGRLLRPAMVVVAKAPEGVQSGTQAGVQPGAQPQAGQQSAA